MSYLRFFLFFVILLEFNVAIAKPILRGKRGSYIVTEIVSTTQAKAWAVLTDFTNQAVWAPDITQTTILRQDDKGIKLVNTYKAAYTFGIPIRVQLDIVMKPKRSFTYQLVHGDRLNSLHGSWEIVPGNNTVTLRHTITVKPQVPELLLPFYYEHQEQNLRQWMVILKRQIEKR